MFDSDSSLDFRLSVKKNVVTSSQAVGRRRVRGGRLLAVCACDLSCQAPHRLYLTLFSFTHLLVSAAAAVAVVVAVALVAPAAAAAVDAAASAAVGAAAGDSDAKT